MDQAKYRRMVIWVVYLVGGFSLSGYAQTYHTVSATTAQVSYGSGSNIGGSIQAAYSFGKRSWEALGALEIPLNHLASADEWAGEKLTGEEKASVKRYRLLVRLRTRPEVGSLGFQLGLNYARLRVTFENPPVFGATTRTSVLESASYGLGLFRMHTLPGKVINFFRLEGNLFTDFDTVELWADGQLIFRHDLKLGIKVEALQPRPRFSNLFYGIYVELAIRR